MHCLPRDAFHICMDASCCALAEELFVPAPNTGQDANRDRHLSAFISNIGCQLVLTQSQRSSAQRARAHIECLMLAALHPDPANPGTAAGLAAWTWCLCPRSHSPGHQRPSRDRAAHISRPSKESNCQLLLSCSVRLYQLSFQRNLAHPQI